jgi:NAD(P)H dehydrogenase (quinone)
MNNISKVLILGATGNIGGLTAQALAVKYPDINLRLTSSRDSGCDALRALHPQAEVLKADWYDPSSLPAAFAGVDKVFIVSPDFYTDENIATPNLIHAIKEAGSLSQVLRLISLPPGLTADQLEPEILATRCGANLSVIAKPLFDDSGLPMTYLNAASWLMFNVPWFLAAEIKQHRRLAMPQATHASRLWLSESDVAAAAAKVLADDAATHVGREYLITGTERIDFHQLAELLGEVIGEPITLADDEQSLRAATGEAFDLLMTYFRHETRDYVDVPVTDTFAQLTGRPPLALRDYLTANRALFI